MRIGIVIQARMGSSRLPGKIMKPLAGRSMLCRIIQRASGSEYSDFLVVALPYLESDDVAAEEACSAGADVIRGSEDDVLGRYVQAIFRYELDIVVRLTADNPFVEGRVIDLMIDRLRRCGLDYIHNIKNSGYPLGTCVEVVRAEALQEAFAQSDRQLDHEHVTRYLHRKNTKFEVGLLQKSKSADNLRLTVDTKKDYCLASWIYNQMKDNPTLFTLDDVVSLSDIYPAKFKVNKNVQQKNFQIT